MRGGGFGISTVATARLQAVIVFLALLTDGIRGQQTSLAQKPEETINLALDTETLNQLIADVQSEFFPALVAFTNSAVDSISSTAIEGTCCNIGDIGVKATTRIFGFSLGNVNQNEISLVSRANVKPNSVRLGLAARNVRIAAKVETGVGAAFLVPLACFIGAEASVNIPFLEFTLDLTVAPNGSGQVIALEFGGLNLPLVNVVLFPIIDNICSVISALLSLVFTTLSFALSLLILPIFQSYFQTFITEQLAEPFNFTGLIPTIPLGNTSEFTPDIGIARIQSEDGVLELGLSTKFTSTLRDPDFRDGFSYVTEFAPDVLLPRADPAPPSFFSANLGLIGANKVIESAFYLAWAQISTEPESLKSALCVSQATRYDPCPFPPITGDAGFWGTFLLTLVFLLNGGVGGIFLKYSISVSIASPELDVQNGLLQGKLPVTFLVEGVPLFDIAPNSVLLEISSDAVLQTAFPAFDSATGILSNIALSKVALQNPVFNFRSGKPLFGIGYGLVFAIVAEVFNGVFDVVLTIVNAFIAAYLENTPLFQFPLLPFVTADKATRIRIEGTGISGVAAGPGSSAFVKIDAGVQIDVVDNPQDGAGAGAGTGDAGFLDSEIENSMARSRAYKIAYEMALESGNPDGTFFSSFFDPVTGDQEKCMFRLSSEDELGPVQVRCDPEPDWAPAPSPIE